MKIKKIRTYRIISQITVFILLNLGLVIGFYGFPVPVFYCHASPFASTICPIGAIEYAVIVAPILLVYIFGVLTLFSIIFGRAMCGWACPIGALQDIFSIKSKFKTIKFLDDHHFRLFKYIILVLIPIGSYILKDKIFTDIGPVGGLTATIPTLLIMPQGLEPIEPFFIIKMILTVAFLILILFVMKGWCKYFCPLGAYFALHNSFSLITIKYTKTKCLDCPIPLCAKACPMNLDPRKDIDSGECIRCGRCVDACITDALQYGIRFIPTIESNTITKTGKNHDME